jgi:hypothetical protein
MNIIYSAIFDIDEVTNKFIYSIISSPLKYVHYELHISPLQYVNYELSPL